MKKSEEYEAKLNIKEKELDAKSQKLDRKIDGFTFIAWLFVVLGFVVGVWGYFCSGIIRLSELGDFYGGTVASLWSLAGLFFIFVAFLGQKQQLISQQIELKQNKLELIRNHEELGAQRVQMELQNQTLRKQQFESSFFGMLNVVQETVASMGFSGWPRTSEKITGKMNFTQGIRLLFQEYQDLLIDHNIKAPSTLQKTGAFNSSNDLVEKIRSLQFAAFDKYYSKYYFEIFGHYFRLTYNILNFIDKYDFNLENEETNFNERLFYVNIFKATMSSNELGLLFHNALSPNGIKKVFPLYEKYGFLENIHENSLLEPEIDFNYYPETKFHYIHGYFHRKERLNNY